MILPVTFVSALLLLLLSLVCLGLWLNAFKATGARWRFELFSFDFSVGALLLLLIAAYTFGTFGSDLAFSDRMLVSGRTNEALALIAGAVFNFGNMLLLASVALLGISTAFPLSVGVGLIVTSFFHFHSGNVAYLIAGIVIMIGALVLEIRSVRRREAAAAAAAAAAAKKEPVPVPAEDAPPKVATTQATSGVHHHRRHRSKPRPPAKPKRVRKFLRGMIAAMLGGIAFGLFVPILEHCMTGDLGLGPYAGMLLFGVGVLGSTIVYNFYFLNITIEGSPLTYAAYLKGKLGQHLLGFLGGALCLGGLLAASLAAFAATTAKVPRVLDILLPLLGVPLAFLCAIGIWKELSIPAASKLPLLAGIGLFTCSLIVLSFGFAH
jgi:glucose uptake protein